MVKAADQAVQLKSMPPSIRTAYSRLRVAPRKIVDKGALQDAEQLVIAIASYFHAVQAHLDVLELNGFLVDWNDSQPPGKRVLLRELPVAKGTMFGVEDFRELLGLIGQAEDEGMFRTRAGTGGIHSRSGEAPPPRPRKVWSVLVSKACRSAIMIGTALKRREMAEECAAMADLDHPWNCPHGRPTMRHLSDLRAVRMEKLETLLKPEQLERLGVC
jgi:DNA mismatch repair ATPase MutL